MLTPQLTARQHTRIRLALILALFGIGITFRLSERGFLRWIPAALLTWTLLVLIIVLGGLLIALVFVSPVQARIANPARSDEDYFLDLATRDSSRRAPGQK